MVPAHSAGVTTVRVFESDEQACYHNQGAEPHFDPRPGLIQVRDPWLVKLLLVICERPVHWRNHQQQRKR